MGTAVAEKVPGGPAIETSGLTKRYGGRSVVDSLDMEVPDGVVAGFIGPNGAGKTTTLRMLLGLVRPSAGSGRVLGMPLTAPARYVAAVGALIESPGFHPGLSGQRNLAIVASLAGLSDRSSIPALLERVGLGDRGRDVYRTYSLGMKQRLGIAAALIGGPALLILDEPANGLDPSGIREMRTLLRSFNDEGRTVFVSSHQLAEVQQVCDWLVVIDRGRRIFQGPTSQLVASNEALVLRSEHPACLASRCWPPSWGSSTPRTPQRREPAWSPEPTRPLSSLLKLVGLLRVSPTRPRCSVPRWLALSPRSCWLTHATSLLPTGSPVPGCPAPPATTATRCSARPCSVPPVRRWASCCAPQCSPSRWAWRGSAPWSTLSSCPGRMPAAGSPGCFSTLSTWAAAT